MVKEVEKVLLDFVQLNLERSEHSLYKGPYFKDLVLNRTFLSFWVLNGSLFTVQGPYFHFFGFIHAKNVNSVCMYTTMVPV